jgi:hypothetical protein
MEEVVGSIPTRSTKLPQAFNRSSTETPFPSNPRSDLIVLSSSCRDLDRIKKLRLCRHLRGVHTVGVQRRCRWLRVPQDALNRGQVDIVGGEKVASECRDCASRSDLISPGIAPAFTAADEDSLCPAHPQTAEPLSSTGLTQIPSRNRDGRVFPGAMPEEPGRA